MDIGFRKLDDNNLRLAAFADEKFNYNLLNLNISAKNKVNDLKSIIDKEFLKFKEELKLNFKLYASKHKLIEKYSEDSSNEEKILFKLTNLMRARSPYKLYSTYKQLSNLINDKDVLQVKLFDILKKYAYHHHHLNTFKANTERKFILRRREQFRVLSKKLKDNYSKLYIEDINLSKFAEKSEIVSKNELSNKSRNQRFDAGLSILRICLENKFGENLIKVNPAYTSKIHNKCGNKIELDNSKVEQNCPHCNELFDRDFNAAINILQKGKMSSASGEVTSKVTEVLASLKAESDQVVTKVA